MKKIKIDIGLSLAFLLLIIGISCLFIPFQQNDGFIKIFGRYINIKDYGDLGSFIGGITTPFLSIAAFILLYRTYQSQKKELELTRGEMKEQNEYARNNLRVSIGNLFIKTASEYSHGCNQVWRKEHTQQEFYINTITEIIISLEVMDRLVEVYKENHIDEKLINTMYYLFWKQLDVDIRGWIKNSSMPLAQTRPIDDVYRKQIETIHSKLSEYFE